MSKKSVHLLFIFLALSGYWSKAQILNSPFITKTYTSQDGLPHSYIYEILQDNKGYLWVGTRFG
jgi:ligand-binding sensor domain-containing protein